VFLNRRIPLLAAVWLFALAGVLHAENQILAQVKFDANGGDEKKAGVWVDGQYVGFVKELKRDKKLYLLPGKHQIVVRQAWYADQVEDVVLEPGEVRKINLKMLKEQQARAPQGAAELKIKAFPLRAAVFIDEQFTGHVDEFDSAGQGILLTPGEHHVRIALPGYQPFETVVNLRPYQKMKIQTSLMYGSVTESGPQVVQEARGRGSE
jgi:hypothetical protein